MCEKLTQAVEETCGFAVEQSEEGETQELRISHEDLNVCVTSKSFLDFQISTIAAADCL